MKIARCFGLLFCSLIFAEIASGAEAPPIPPQAAEMITKAAPEKATVQPKRPRRLLVYTHAQGYVHESIPYCAYALREMGRKTGAFTAEISHDPAVFEASSLS